ncbi:hypothetical protein [Lacunimicrobium album]
MNRIVTRSKIAPDGTVTVQLPLKNAGEEVKVTVQPLIKEKLTQAEWAAWVESMAGSIEGPIEIDDEGDFEIRDELQ